MISKKKIIHASFLAVLVGIFCLSASGCTHRDPGNDLEKGAALLRDYAIKSNPALKGNRFKISLAIDGALGDCMCVKVCDSKGQNCGPCSCIPANCGGCD